jgi:transcription initiation factor TFIID subunit 4
MSDRKGVHMLQSRPPNIHPNAVQATQHHLQRPQTSLPVFGTNNINARPFPQSIGGPTVPLRPQMADSSQRGQFVQGGISTRPALQSNQPSRQQQSNKEQKANSFISTAHMNKETANQPAESAQSSFATSNAKQVNPALISSKGGGILENQSSGLASSKSLTTAGSSQPHRSHGTPTELKMQVCASMILCCTYCCT